MSISFFRRKWFQVVLGGTILYLIAVQVLRITGNPNYVPTVLLLGAFVVPIAFAVFFYERERSIDRASHADNPLSMGIVCFFIGGVLGVIAAGLVEYETLKSLGPGGLFGVGLIEESAKLILPIVLFLRVRFRTEADGLLFGVASGMGFAALETMGYGLVVLIKSQGDIGVLQSVLLIRGLLSPAGHAAWTGLVCAALWRERVKKGHATVNFAVIGTFILVIVLHAMWDIVNSLGGPSAAELVIAIGGNLVIAAIGLTLLFRRLHESYRFVGTKTPEATLS